MNVEALENGASRVRDGYIWEWRPLAGTRDVAATQREVLEKLDRDWHSESACKTDRGVARAA
jgi:hypothetical protein